LVVVIRKWNMDERVSMFVPSNVDYRGDTECASYVINAALLEIQVGKERPLASVVRIGFDSKVLHVAHHWQGHIVMLMHWDSLPFHLGTKVIQHFTRESFAVQIEMRAGYCLSEVPRHVISSI
jgi:hypothetical protein